MSTLATYGVCLGIAIVVLLVMMSSPIALIIMIFPAMMAGIFTGEKGMFNPNGGSGSKSTWYHILLFFFIILETLALAAALLGLYHLLWRLPASQTTPVVNKDTLPGLSISYLQIIHKTVFGFTAYFAILYVFHNIKNIENLKTLRGILILKTILPAIAYPIGIVFLIDCHHFLQGYTQATSLVLSAMPYGIFYLAYVVYKIIEILYALFLSIRHSRSSSVLEYQDRQTTSLSWAYSFLYIFFFYQIHLLS